MERCGGVGATSHVEDLQPDRRRRVAVLAVMTAAATRPVTTEVELPEEARR